MNYEKKVRRISNSYYNLGLEQAKKRDLTAAAENLKKCLHFNKYHTDARNLLGLVYYEVGETADALVQWVISTNLKPRNNRAQNYLDEIQGNERYLEVESQNIKKYNQALFHAQGGSDDLAVLQLNRIVENKPNYIKADLLLALIHMKRLDYAKAGKLLTRVLQIDRNNSKARYYLSYMKANTSRTAEREKDRDKGGVRKAKKNKKLDARQMMEDDVIIPPTYKEYSGLQTILNILVGLVLGGAVVIFLVMPANTRAINSRHNQEIIRYSEQLNQKNQEIDGQKSTVEELTRQKEAAEQSLAEVTSGVQGESSQYEILIGVLQAYRTNDFETAVKLYSQMDSSLITDPNVNAIVADIRLDMEARGYQVLEKLADEASAGGNPQGAIEYYQKSLLLKGDNPEVLYKTAMVYKGMGDIENANSIFSQVIDNFPNSRFAKKAQTERGY